MNRFPTFSECLKKYALHTGTHNVLLAVSGGLDSVVLCQLTHEAGIPFAMAHCNFSLRGAESDRDEAFVRGLGEKYGVPVFVKTFDTAGFAEVQKLSLQEAARHLRYPWFNEVRKAQQLAYTLLAHHADDNIETLLMHFFRGTGLDGLTGMPEEKADARCLRPMLHLRRSEIAAFANEKGLQWVEDSSNASNKYTRNFFRNNLIPQLQKMFPRVEENLLGNIQRLQQTKVLYKTAVEALKKKVCEIKGEEVHIPVLKLLNYQHTSLIYEIIRDFGFGEKYVAEVLKLANAASGKYVANEGYRIIRHRAWLIIAPRTIAAQTIVIEKGEETVLFGPAALRLKNVPIQAFSLDKLPGVAQLDAREISFPLVLRPWRPGDYFYPLGMRKKKKLARFFIDQKLSKTEKEKVWVLESHKRIVWIVGHRIDDRFKVTENTKAVLRLSLSSL